MVFLFSAFATNFNLESFLHHIKKNFFVVGNDGLAVACVNFFVCSVVVCEGYVCSVILQLVMQFDFSPVFILCSATKLQMHWYKLNYKRFFKLLLNYKQNYKCIDKRLVVRAVLDGLIKPSRIKFFSKF